MFLRLQRKANIIWSVIGAVWHTAPSKNSFLLSYSSPNCTYKLR